VLKQRVITAIVLLAILLLLLLTRCQPRPAGPGPGPEPSRSPVSSESGPSTPASLPEATQPDEVLTPATVQVPAQVVAGAAFSVAWTGPDNAGDYVTVVRPDAPAAEYRHYRETSEGASLQLTAPIEPGTYEVRYVANRSKTVLGRAPIEVIAAGATVDAPASVILGAEFSIAWTGPNNEGDFITIVPVGTADEKYAAYVYTDKGSPVTLLAPTETGAFEVRYVTGQGKKVLARQAIEIAGAEVTLEAPGEAIAGASLPVTWTGPNNGGDYITVVEASTPDGRYGNYTQTSAGSPLEVLLPIMAGPAESRYMTGQGNKVLGRRAITIKAAEVTLAADPEGKADSEVEITWTGPNNRGDYITVVVAGTPDGQYAGYTYTTAGSPLKVKAPKATGDAEIRYMTGQGNVVLARIPIKIVP